MLPECIKIQFISVQFGKIKKEIAGNSQDVWLVEVDLKYCIKVVTLRETSSYVRQVKYAGLVRLSKKSLLSP